MARSVVVIGGGVIGLLAAFHLRRAGVEVVVLERGRTAAGCSAGNAGWVTPALSLPVPTPALRGTGLAWLLRVDSPLYIKPAAAPALVPWLWKFWRACTPQAFEHGASALQAFARDAPQQFRELRDAGVRFDLGGDGLLMVYHDRSALEAQAALVERLGCGPAHRLDPSDVVEREPALGRGTPPAGGLHVLPEVHVRPESFCAGVAAACREVGVRFIEGRAVDGVRRESRRVRAVLHGGLEVEADAFLVATGAEAGRLARLCGTRLPIQAGKGYAVTVREPRVAIRHPLYMAETRVGLTPFADGHRAAGTMELSGINTRLDPRRLAAFRRSAEAAIPGILDGSATEDWVGMRPMTPDGLPLMGRLPSTGNVWISTGHQMLGITLAPASGRTLAHMIVPDSPSAPGGVDVEAFDPGRWS